MFINASNSSKSLLQTLLLGVCMLGFSSPALGLENSESKSLTQDPQWMVVTTQTQPVRCGDQELYYTIAEFEKGTVVAVDGTSGDYSKVRYPATLGALVSVDEAQPTKGGSHIKLLEESWLKAASMLRGIDGSWNPVYPIEQSPLPQGTELKVLETIKDKETGEVLGYRVAPPRPPVVESYPYAYIYTNSLRPATPGEIKAHLGGKSSSANQPKPTAVPNKPVQMPPVEPLELEPVIEPEPTIETVDQTVDQTGDETIETTDETVEKIPPVVIENTTPVTRPTTINPEKSGSTRSSSAHITAASLEALEASFTNARTMPREQLDEALPELLAEFTRTRQAVGDDASEARPLDQRIEWLRIRMQTRDQRRAIARALASADQQSLELNRKMQRWNDSQVYALVGRLMVSGVYTGEHLPLLYRVQAPDPITGFERTIGYVAPKSEGESAQDLRAYLGQVVGIVGDPVEDQSLSMRVLSPVRVDLMPGQ